MDETPLDPELDEPEPIEAGPRALVVVVTSPRDFAIARERGWYRIPVDRAPPHIGADYLAFYLTQAFGEERWSVRHYAPVRRLRVVRRVELLPEEPDHPRAQERYYRFDIGPVIALPHPIPSARLRRITFIPTSVDRLLAAEEINDLWEREPVQERLWQALKESGWWPEYLWELAEGKIQYAARVSIPCKRGELTVVLGPIPQEPVPPPSVVLGHEALSEDLAACLRKVRLEIELLGGAVPPAEPQG